MNESLYRLIQVHAKTFGLIRIHAEQELDRIRQTAFSWTDTPGSLCLAVNKKYFREARDNTNIVAIIASPGAVLNTRFPKSVVVAEQADELFYFLHNAALHEMCGVQDQPEGNDIAESAVIADTVVVGKNITIGDNVTIGHGCIILDHTTIGEGTDIGPKCVIGVDGLFSKQILGEKVHVRHFGGVRIGRFCKLHSDITVSRSANFSEYTTIGDYVHVGHKSVLGHDCRIGEGTDISAMALIAGRVRVGNHCWIGANAVISNACAIGDDTKVRIGAVVISDLAANTDVSGNFAIMHRNHLKRFFKG